MRFSSHSSSRTQKDNMLSQRTRRRQRGDRSQFPQPPLRRRSPIVLLLLLLFWSVILGMGLAQAKLPAAIETIAQATAPAQSITPDPAGLVDPVAANHQLGQQLYLENCATCHVGIPPAAMPTESWREILTKPYHYGAQITPLTQPSLQVEWNYISFYSRPLQEGEDTPFRLKSSRYFKVLHPKVDFPEPVTVRSCVTCHPAAEQFNYRSLTPAWENGP